MNTVLGIMMISVSLPQCCSLNIKEITLPLISKAGLLESLPISSKRFSDKKLLILIFYTNMATSFSSSKILFNLSENPRNALYFLNKANLKKIYFSLTIKQLFLLILYLKTSFSSLIDTCFLEITLNNLLKASRA